MEMKRLIVALLLCATPALAGSPTMTTTHVTVGTSATRVAIIDAASLHREVENTIGAATVYCGSSNAVTSGNGTPIPTNYGYDYSGYTGEIWCVVSSSQVVALTIW